MAIYLTGDTHGTLDVGKLEHFFFYQEGEFTKNDYLIICGDVGVCGFAYCLSKQTQSFLSSLPVTVLFIDGNHENHVDLNNYAVDEWNGGKVHIISEDIIHLMRGQVYVIEGKKIFTFGGAFSIDRENRLEEVTWFHEEIPSKMEYKEAWKNLELNNFSVDYIITHTAPREIVAEFGFGGEQEAEGQTDEFQRFADQVEFKHWFCGHFHIDEDVEDVFHCLMERVVNLNNFL